MSFCMFSLVLFTDCLTFCNTCLLMYTFIFWLFLAMMTRLSGSFIVSLFNGVCIVRCCNRLVTAFTSEDITVNQLLGCGLKAGIYEYPLRHHSKLCSFFEGSVTSRQWCKLNFGAMSLVEEFHSQAEDREDQATDMKDYVNTLNNE